MRDIWTRRIAFVLLGGLIGSYTPESARLAVLGIFVMLVIRVILWRPRDFFGPSLRPELLGIVLGILVGVLYGYTGVLNLERPLVLNRVEVTGELLDWSTYSDKAQGSFRIIDPIPVQSSQSQEPLDFQNKKYRLRVYPNSEGELPEGWQRAQPGDILRFTAKLEQPNSPGTAGQFDYPLYYAVRELSGGLTAQGDAEIVRPGQPPVSWSVRTHVRNLLEQFSTTPTGVLEGILFGDTSRIPEEDLERYRITGVYHVFSASGANVAFLLILCWGILRFLPVSLRVGVSSSVLIFYAILCGGNPPILRATVMGILVLFGRLGTGRSNSLRGLLIAGLILFIWQPLNLKDIGFQLSFLATWGIIVLSPRLLKMKKIQSWPQVLKVAFATTVAAQIATLPLLSVAFHRLSLIGLVANLSVMFILGSVFEVGMIGVILSFSSTLALPFLQVSLWLLSIMNGVLFYLAQVPFADVWIINPGILFWIAWYGGITILLIGKERVGFTLKVWVYHLNKRLGPAANRVHHVLRGILPKDTGQNVRVVRQTARFYRQGLKQGKIRGDRILLVTLIFLLLWSPWNSPHVLEVTFIDVGQGDSILIETPKGTRILIDTGPKTEHFDAGVGIILPYLLEKGIKHLDALILTHSHADHVGGAASLLEEIPVDWVGVPEDGHDWTSIGVGEMDGIDRDLVNQLASKKIERLKAGDRLILDSDIQLSVLAPGEILTGTHSDENNNSLVLRLENKTRQSVLLTADMEQEEMRSILEAGQDFSADLFKVPHHGSRFSLVTDWLDKIDPKAVIIPVGKNSFGHPNTGVLKYWEERQVPIYRTDERGTVNIRLDEKGIEVIPGRAIIM